MKFTCSCSCCGGCGSLDGCCSHCVVDVRVVAVVVIVVIVVVVVIVVSIVAQKNSNCDRKGEPDYAWAEPLREGAGQAKRTAPLGGLPK